MNFSDYIPICDAMVILMNPLVEIVIHDIESDRIVYINGQLSKRQVGDASLLDKEALNDLSLVVYPKISFDGKLVKSISVIIQEKWLLCINCDISVFSKMESLCVVLLGGSRNAQPKALFTNDWQEKLHVCINKYIQIHHLSFQNLTNSNKRELISYLFEQGAFNEKKSANYIAEVLNMSRSTIFKYLKKLRK